MVKIRFIESMTRPRQNSGGNMDTRFPEAPNPTSGHPGIGVGTSDHHPYNPRLNCFFRAGRGFSIMVAWLQSHIESSHLRLVTGHIERVHFRMGSSRFQMSAGTY